MRVLMTTTGLPGHALPLAPFGRACRRAGHEVRVPAPRSRATIVERMGLELRPCSDPADNEVRRILATVSGLGRREGHARMMSEGFAGILARAALPDVLEAVGEWRPDVVVHESQEYAGALAAERGGIPHVRVALGLAVHEEATLSIAAATVDELRGELGLPVDPTAEALRESPVLTVVPSVLEASGAAAPRAVHRFRQTRERARPSPVWWRGDGEPLVYLTFGSVAGALGLYPRAARVLVTVGEDVDPAALGAPPPNVRVERWVAQEAVLPHADLVVCHGGFGSVLGALAHGVPLVVLPFFGDDQWLNAGRVAQVEAGVALDGDREPAGRMFDGPGPAAFASLADATRTVLADPRYRRAAREIAGAIDDLPPVDAAVDVLEAIAA